MATKKPTLKLLIDTKSRQVLFAEAGKDAVDSILSLLLMPTGAYAKALSMGCIANVQDSAEKLDGAYFLSDRRKEALLCPGAAVLEAGKRRKYFYRCSKFDGGSWRCGGVTDVAGTRCPWCKEQMETVVPFMDPDTGELTDEKVDDKEDGEEREEQQEQEDNHREDKDEEEEEEEEHEDDDEEDEEEEEEEEEGGGGGGGENELDEDRNGGEDEEKGDKGFVKWVAVKYTVTDDLWIAPVSAISTVALLNDLGVKDIGVLREKTVKIGPEEGLEILKASFQSKTVLTDVFLGKKRKV